LGEGIEAVKTVPIVTEAGISLTLQRILYNSLATFWEATYGNKTTKCSGRLGFYFTPDISIKIHASTHNHPVFLAIMNTYEESRVFTSLKENKFFVGPTTAILPLFACLEEYIKNL
jgi:hypothetical protein